MITNKNLGIENLKKLVLFICTFTLAMREIAHKSNFGILVSMGPLLFEVRYLLQNLANVKAELADLDPKEIAQLADIVAEKMNISTQAKAENFILQKIAFVQNLISEEAGENE